MRKEVLAVGCALMVFCGCGKNNAAQHYESGWAAMGKKDYTTAVNEFQQVIDQNSRLAEVTGQKELPIIQKRPIRRRLLLFREV